MTLISGYPMRPINWRNIAKIEAIEDKNNGKIMIERVHNLLTQKELEKKYGFFVANWYRNSDIVAYKENKNDFGANSDIIIFNKKEEYDWTQKNVHFEKFYTKEEFGEIVSLLKQAGHCLVEAIRKKKRKYKEIEIKI